MKTILLVDDRPDDLRSLQETLGTEQYRILTAQNGTEALAVLLGDDLIDLVITEYRIPDMDGFEFLATVRRRYPFLPVILVSPYYDLESYVRTLGVGVFDYLNKPVHPPYLRNAVNAALKGPTLTDASSAA